MFTQFKVGQRIRIDAPHHQQFKYIVHKICEDGDGLILRDLREIEKNYTVLTVHCISKTPLDFYLQTKAIETFNEETKKWQAI